MRPIAPVPCPVLEPQSDRDAAPPTRREALARIGTWALASTLPAAIAACGGGGDPITPVSAAPAPAPAPGPAPAPPPPAPPAGTPLGRLKAALAAPAIGAATLRLSVTQGAGNTVATTLGAGAVFMPPMDNPQRQTLATVPQLWGFRRDLWRAQPGAVIGSVVYPMSRDHIAATSGSNGVCGLHFHFDGAAFEMLLAGTTVQVTLIVDGRYASDRTIGTVLDAGVPGAPLATPNTLVRFDFGTRAARKVSVYATSTQGPCALVVGAADRIEPWDRSGEAAFAVMTESYGQVASPHWGGTGPFWEAAALLGIPHLDRDAIGGTGYAPNNATAETRNPGNAFGARLPSNVDASPDLFLTAGSLNDNNSVAALPLYASGAEARAAFDAAVAGYYRDLRSALPNAVLAATGPWAPRQSIPTDPVARSKAETIRLALRSVGGPWVFLDNLGGGWSNSAGASATTGGPWQTGTGRVGAPAGDGNADTDLSSDGVHPSETGSLRMATRIAADLRAAIEAL